MNKKQTTVLMTICIISGILIGVTVLTGNTTEAIPLEQVQIGDTMILYKNEAYTYKIDHNIGLGIYWNHVKYGGLEAYGFSTLSDGRPFFNTWASSDSGAGIFYIRLDDTVHFGQDGKWKVVEYTSDHVRFERA